MAFISLFPLQHLKIKYKFVHPLYHPFHWTNQPAIISISQRASTFRRQNSLFINEIKNKNDGSRSPK